MDQRMYPTGGNPRGIGTRHIEVVAVTGDKVAQAHGEVTLDGSNPTSVATGLANIKSAQVSFKRTTAPGLDPTTVTCSYAASGGQLDIYAWKPTGAADTTLIASTNATAVVAWTAQGDLY